MVYVQGPNFVQQGWQCPVCMSVNAPWSPMCLGCQPGKQKTWTSPGTGTGEPPLVPGWPFVSESISVDLPAGAGDWVTYSCPPGCIEVNGRFYDHAGVEVNGIISVNYRETERCGNGPLDDGKA